MFGSRRDLNLQPTVSTYNAVLKSCVRGKCYSRALTTMTDLRTSGKRPEQETWELLVEACIVCGRWECAVEVVRDMYAEEVGERCMPLRMVNRNKSRRNMYRG